MKTNHWFFLFLAFFAIAAIIYSPSLGGPFQYDDYAQILDNKVLTGRPLPKLLSSIFRFTAHPDGWTGTRDFVRATFLLNWQWWGERPLGYRWVNLSVHVVNSWLVSLLVSLLLSLSYRQSSVGGEARIGKRQSSSVANDQRQPPHETGFPTATASLTPIFAGLLFLVHPLNSQAVAYVAQRFTSVAALFYLLTIILYIKVILSRHSEAEGRRIPTGFLASLGMTFPAVIYYLLAVISALLAYNSKEISVTLPAALVAVTIAKNAKFSETREHVRSRFSLLFASFAILPFFLLALKIPLQTATAAAAGGEAAAQPSPKFLQNPLKSSKIDLGAFALQQKEDLLSRRDYFLTQISVVATYLRLAVLPVNQTLDYDYPITRAPDPKTLALAALHLGLIGIGIWFLLVDRQSSVGGEARIGKRQSSSVANDQRQPPHETGFPTATASLFTRRLIGAGILWFYLTLLPESSVIPIPDVIYEHRAYLPMVGLIIAAAALFSHCELRRRRSVAISSRWLLVAGCLLLSIATLRRAYVWGNEVRLWHDVYAKAPDKPRAVKNYGVVLAASGKYDDGIKLLEKAVVLDPDNADYWSNLGTANLRANRFDPAKDKFLTAYNLLAAELGLPSYDSLNLLNPPNSLIFPSEKSRRQAAQYLNDYGVCLVQLDRGEEALEAFQKSLAIDPGLYAARLGLGAAYNLMGETQQAIDVFEAAVEEFPDLPDAYNNLAVMYKKAGRLEDHDRILRAAPKAAKTPQSPQFP